MGTTSVDEAAPAGSRGYDGQVTELDVKLTGDHGGLPAGSEIRVGFAEAAARTAPRSSGAPATTTTETTQLGPLATRQRPAPQKQVHGPPRIPLRARPKLTAGMYAFPVFGVSSFSRYAKRPCSPPI